MSSRVLHYAVRHMLLASLLAALILLRGTLIFASALQSQPEPQDESTTSTDPSCKVHFADSYFASIATTMPIAGHAPLAQTGHLYVDQTAGAVRIDQFFRSHRTTFLLDNKKLRGFFFFGERDFQRTTTTTTSAAEKDDLDSSTTDSDDTGDDALQQHCQVFYLPRTVAPFCVPHSYRVDSHPSLIRGVAATRFAGMEGFPGMPLVEQSLYVVNASSPCPSCGAAAPLSSPSLSFVPWRLEYRARPDLEPHKIAAASYELPNWRFFGHPMFDELTLSRAQETQLQLWQPAVDLMTVDFYDYYSTEHDDGVFAVPPQCTAVLRRDTAGSSKNNSTADAEFDGGDASELRKGEPRLQLANIQRFLLQWYLLNNMTPATSAGEGSEH